MDLPRRLLEEPWHIVFDVDNQELFCAVYAKPKKGGRAWR